MTGNKNNTRTETDFTSVEDTLDRHRTAWNEASLFFQIANITSKEDVIIAPRDEKISQAFPCFFPTATFDHNNPWDTPISLTQYFNQRLLN